MRFALLGVLEARATNGPLNLGHGKQRALLAVLLLHANQAVASDELIDALWPTALPVRARKSLQLSVSRLRALIGPDRLVTAPDGYLLRVEVGELDVDEFERLSELARPLRDAGDALGAEATLAAALAVWRGPALAEFRYASFAQEPIRRLDEARATVRAELVDVRIALGRETEVLAELEALISERPYWERLRRAKMLALYRAGRQVDALAVFRETRRLLAEDLGLEPGPELQQLEREILSQDPAIAPPSTRLRLMPVSRRAGTVSLLVGLAALACALVFVELGLRGHNSARPRVVASSLAVLDARSGRLAADVPEGASPGAVAAGPGAVWIANDDDNSVSRIDLATAAVRQSIPVGEEPEAVTTGGGAVWVANSRGGTVSRINEAAGRVVQTIRVGNGPAGIAYGNGAIWVANAVDGTVSRIDAVSGRRTNTWPAVIGAAALTYAFGLVWVASPTAGSVIALEPGSGTVVDHIDVGVEPDAIAAGDGAIWVANRADGTVSQIDPGPPAHVVRAIHVGLAPVALAVASSGVWAATGDDDSIERIEPVGNPDLHVVHLGMPPVGINVLGGRVYVSVRSSERAHRGGTLRVLGSPPDSLDPAKAYVSQAWDVLTLTNDGLVDFRRTGGTDGIELVPDLASALPTATDDGRTYSFQLRAGIRFSTGQPVLAQDIKRGIERIYEATPPSSGRQYFKQIIGIDQCRPGRRCNLPHGIITDAGTRTITFHLRAPDPDFLTELATPFADAVPTTTAAGQGVPATGPYMIAKYHQNVSLRLIRNPLFRQWSPDAQPQGYPNVITWRFRKDDLDTLPLARQIERRRADIVPRLVPPPLTRLQLATLSIRYPSQLHFNTTQETNFFFLNTRVPPFNNLRIRQAVNEALDRGAFVRELGPGYAATCQIVPPEFPGYRHYCPSGTGSRTAINSARRIVRSNGAAGTHVTVWVIAALAEQGRSIVAFLDELGFQATLKPVAPVPNIGVSYFQAIFQPRTKAQIGFYAWGADFPSETGFMPQFLSCAAFANGNAQLNDDPSEFCDPVVDRLFTRATNAMTDNPTAATSLWQRAEEMVLAQAPFVPIYNPENVAFLAPHVGDFQYNPQYGVLLDQLWVR